MKTLPQQAAGYHKEMYSDEKPRFLKLFPLSSNPIASYGESVRLNVWLILDSGVLCDQQLNECAKQRFASLSHVVNKLEETQVEQEFLLGNAPMRVQPTAQQSGGHRTFTPALRSIH